MSQQKTITVEKSLLEQCLRMMNERTRFTLRSGIDSYALASKLEQALNPGKNLSHLEKEKRVIKSVVERLQQCGYQVATAWDGVEDQVAGIFFTMDHLIDYVTAGEKGKIEFNTPDKERFAIHLVYGNLPLEVIYDMSGSCDESLLAGTAIVEARLSKIEKEAQWL